MNPAPNPQADQHGVTLARIAHAVGATLLGSPDTIIRGIHHDSRRVEPSDLFVARRGEKSDGLRFVGQAVDRGAAAIMAEAEHAPSDPGVPIVLVSDIRVAMGEAARIIYRDPTRALCVVGITGTNGKTTTSYLVDAALRGNSCRSGVLGTLGTHFDGLDLDGAHTTPEADEIARVALALHDRGATHLVMEVSSHALHQRRVDSVTFQVAAFTNLTRDHLDYHGTFEAYASAKARFFHELAPARAAIVVDDPFGESLAAQVKCPVVRVSGETSSSAEIHPLSPVVQDARGTRCEVATPSGIVSLESPLVGGHNLSNLLLALGIVVALDLGVPQAAEALRIGAPVPGRFERCDEPDDDIVVLVDYAHTPDALERALQAIRPLTEKRLICVFGCGGDRDREKRPLMGRVVGNHADQALLTNDNPRGEPPEDIAAEVLEGLRGQHAEIVVELRRDRAIGLAIEDAHAGDVVLIAGKGHEPYQIIGDEVRQFDDRVEARQALAERRRHQTMERG